MRSVVILKPYLPGGVASVKVKKEQPPVKVEKKDDKADGKRSSAQLSWQPCLCSGEHFSCGLQSSGLDTMASWNRVRLVLLGRPVCTAAARTAKKAGATAFCLHKEHKHNRAISMYMLLHKG